MLKIRKIISFIYLLIVMMVLWAPKLTAAQDDQPTLTNPLGNRFDTLGGFLLWLFEVQIALAGILAMVGIVFSGYQLLTAGGNAESVSKAKNRLIWSVIGLVLVMVAGALTRVLVNTLQGGTI